MITFEVKEDRRIMFRYTRWGYHRRGKVAISVKYLNGKKSYEDYRINGERYRLNCPAYTSWYSNGQKYCEAYYINGIFQSNKSWDKQGNPI